MLSGLRPCLAVCFKPQQVLVLSLRLSVVLVAARRSVRRLLTPRGDCAGCDLRGLPAGDVRILTPQYTRDMRFLFCSRPTGLMELPPVLGLAVCDEAVDAARDYACGDGTFFSRCSLRLWVTVAVFGASYAGSLLAYAQQRSDWPYHRYPTGCFFSLGWA